MDANGSRYHALVTRDDWTLRAHPDAHWAWLPDDPAHGAALGQLLLKPLLFEFKAGSAAALPEPTSLAGGVFDAYGNLYSLNAEGTAIRVWSSGSGNITHFWPLPEASAADAEPGAFGPCLPAAPAALLVMDALTVTTGHYLVVASIAAGGLLIFDLHGGGPPLPQPWPAMPAPQALLALDDGGVALFGAGTLHRLGPDLRPCVPRVVSPSAFSPEPAPEPPPPDPPCQLALGADATACAALPGGRFLVLRVKMDGLYLSVIDWAGSESASVGPLEEQIEQATADQQATVLSLRSLAVEWPTNASEAGFNVLVLALSGDQAFRFKAAESDAGVWSFELQRDFIPLRRYVAGGLASLAPGQVLHRFPSARAFCAGADRWLPLLTLPRPRCEREGELLGPVWDSATPACVWHRIALDARRPPGSRLLLQSRAADTPEGLALQPWRSEPDLQPHPAGSELPWRHNFESGPLGSCKEFQTLTCLLQAATGRYLQLRIKASGDGQQSPGLASLRAWYPRFSYLPHYLPAVYRADPASAEFSGRFLALFEGELTRWEDRIAAAQLLLDARTAPRDTLEWLANWLALTFDGSNGPARRRALLRHAAQVHARRGTVPGMLLAATLAWEPDDVDAEPFLTAPEALPERVHGLRLQELFGLAPPLAAGAWRPAQGRAALLARLAGDESLLGDLIKLQQALGFVPRAAQEEAVLMASWRLADLPEDEPRPRDAAFDTYLQATQPCAPLRHRWQDYLARRWRRISLLNAAWGTAWRGFDRIPSPLSLPAGSVALADWWRFEAQIVRALGPAHRFRVVLPLPTDTAQLDFDELARRRAAVERAVARDKPAHTVAEIRFGFELFRVGEARLGHDTRLEHGLLRRPELAALTSESIWPPLVLGERDLGGGQLTHPRPLPPPDRVGLDR